MYFFHIKSLEDSFKNDFVIEFKVVIDETDEFYFLHVVQVIAVHPVLLHESENLLEAEVSLRPYLFCQLHLGLLLKRAELSHCQRLL